MAATSWMRGVRPLRARGRWSDARRVGRAAVPVLLILALWFGFLELRGLYFPDEGRYAEIPREMVASGDWVTPRLNGVPYFEKPPLQYWVTAAIYAVAGEDEWTTRVWPALAGLAAVLAVLATARRLYSRRAGWMAAAVMGSCWGYFLASQFVTLDVSLSAFMTGALCAFLLAQDARAGASAHRAWMLAAWALCALAVLTKGPVGIVLPALALATYASVTRSLDVLRRLELLAGSALFAVIAAPWFVLAELRNPGFAEFFFVHEHLLRYTEPVHHRAGPWWYFVPILAGFLMPWFPAIVAAVRGSPGTPRTPRTERRGFDPTLFAWCWAASIFVFFSLSSSKLPPYILPTLGAVALATSRPLVRRPAATVRHTATAMAIVGILVLLLLKSGATWIRVPLVREDFLVNAQWGMLSGAMLAIGALVALWLLLRRRPGRALLLLVLVNLAACQLGVVLAYRIDTYFSAERLIERLVAHEHGKREARQPFMPQLPFYSVDMFDHTVPFYLGRTVTLVHDRSELAWGIEHASDDYIADDSEFERRWRAGDQAYAIMNLATYDQLRDAGLPMRYVDGDGRRVVVSRR